MIKFEIEKLFENAIESEKEFDKVNNHKHRHQTRTGKLRKWKSAVRKLWEFDADFARNIYPDFCWEFEK